MIALARQNSLINSQLPIDRQTKLFATHAIADRETLARSGKSMEGIRLVSPCQDNKNSTYLQAAKDRWEQGDIYWRTGYSYDATQKIVKAISQSSAHPTRREILDRLASIELTSAESSGFVLFNRGKSKISGRHPFEGSVCLLKIKNGKFE